MENRPFRDPGSIRGRGAFKPAFQPYPAPWGRGRQDAWQAPRGRGFAAGLGGLSSRNSNDPVTNAASAPSQPRQIRINDIIFELDAKGSKLTRITPLHDGAETPAEHTIASVKFYRTKNGNLYRSDRYLEMQHKKFVHNLTTRTTADLPPRQARPKKVAELCPKFNLTGTMHLSHPLHDIGPNRNPWTGMSFPATNLYLGQCTRDCKFTHDVNKVAVCKTFLHQGICPAGSACALSHNLTPNRTSACIHFVRGSCTKPDCRYPHIKVNLDAPVCSPFARLGYCEAGADCPNQHSIECPDYANIGRCDDKKCRLPHIDRAGQLRRLAGVQNESVAAPKSPSSSGESEIKVEAGMDLDSDDADGFLLRPSSSGDSIKVEASAFSQQDDYVGFADL
ncbi:hypothetical protein BLS_001122 [Venturia inaequalis]|uniref:C3H1-type domain-containing protein n=1 Tax=Venturia inaequalis TaxID=5025 RepID=A0A8H3U2U1_VENIN|nr:hypothetical protein BLS_001122 [Venturia inaequalis]